MRHATTQFTTTSDPEGPQVPQTKVVVQFYAALLFPDGTVLCTSQNMGGVDVAQLFRAPAGEPARESSAEE